MRSDFVVEEIALQDCRACPRLAAHLADVREAHADYHAAPVPPWGSRRARLLIVGLAPGMHGANRTGQPFTGDASGYFLFESLQAAGLATSARPQNATLMGVRITNAVKCLPPGNHPVAAEISNCRRYLEQELHDLWRPGVRLPRAVLCLGRIAHSAVVAALNLTGPGFVHGQLRIVRPNLILADVYHPSRQNTNTGRLTRPMLDAALAGLLGALEGEPEPIAGTK